MKIKDERGVTGIDISVAIIIILLFVGLITTLIYNYTQNSKEIERKSTATYMIIDILEHAKNSDYDNINNENIQPYISDESKLNKSGYQISCEVKSSENLFGQGADDVMQKVIATGKYNVTGEKQHLDIFTIIKNPNYVRPSDDGEKELWNTGR